MRELHDEDCPLIALFLREIRLYSFRWSLCRREWHAENENCEVKDPNKTLGSPNFRPTLQNVNGLTSL